MQTSAKHAHVPFLEGSTGPRQSACCTCMMGCAPGRRGRKLALSRMRRTSPVPSRAACSAAARLPSTQRQLALSSLPITANTKVCLPVPSQAVCSAVARLRHTLVSLEALCFPWFCWQAKMCAGQGPCEQHAAPLQSCPTQAFMSMHQKTSSHQPQRQILTLHRSRQNATGIADKLELNTLLIFRSLFDPMTAV